MLVSNRVPTIGHLEYLGRYNYKYIGNLDSHETRFVRHTLYSWLTRLPVAAITAINPLSSGIIRTMHLLPTECELQ